MVPNKYSLTPPNNAVLSAFEKGGQWEKAVVLFDHMVEPVGCIFNFSGLIVVGSLLLLKTLRDPDVISYSAVISACEVE